MVRLSSYEKILALVFVLALPLVNPWVRGDGVGYYAFGRALLIEHDLKFEKDWQMANASFRMGRTDPEGEIFAAQYTRTDHLDNHFSIGPAILWSPFLITVHVAVLAWDAMGGHVPADGYSQPYLLAMSLGTALYGFLAVWISFRLARKYVREKWAFVATMGVWFASSLPVYMYFNPSWSHAHSAFIVALFIWYWDRTRNGRSWLQWIILGAIGGLMMDVYYTNGIFLLFPLLESLTGYWKNISQRCDKSLGRLFLKDALFGCAVFAVFLPTLITKRIIYGSYWNFGYTEQWLWNSPALLKVCFSAEHGLFSWTPITIPSIAGLALLRYRDRILAVYSAIAFAAYLYVIGCYQNWHGLSSFGNRFFVSFTAVFILGLSSLFDWLAGAWYQRGIRVLIQTVTAVLVLWNFGLIFQWGTHLIPSRGPISWREAGYNQVAVVPFVATRTFRSYLFRRKQLMRDIEEEDVKQLRSRQPERSQ